MSALLNNQVNYSVGLLIILLLVFWHMCKCSNQPSNNKISCQENYTSNLVYGGAPLTVGGSHTRIINDGNVGLKVPNSMTAMRKLYDEYPQPKTDGISSQLVDMYIVKQKQRKKDAKPSGLTASRSLID